MKHLFFSVFFLLTFSLSAQNLVPNPSFELHDTCPNFDSQLYLATNWIININTVDYYNSCDSIPLDYSVPNNVLGFQEPVTGNAYAGFVAYAHTNPDANEFAGGQLISPLIPGTKYYITFKVSLADGTPNLMCGIDKIGMLFTNFNLGDTILLPNSFLNNFSQIYSSNIVTDTANWIIVQGEYIPDSAYNYFMVGHFFDFAHTDFSCLDSNNINNRFSYYYLDDVCVATDSITCNWHSTGINSLNKNSLEFYPNPANDKIFINQRIDEKIFLIDMMGNEIKMYLSNQTSIDVSDIPDGIYFLKVKYHDKIFLNKKIIIH